MMHLGLVAEIRPTTHRGTQHVSSGYVGDHVVVGQCHRLGPFPGSLLAEYHKLDAGYHLRGYLRKPS